MQDEVTYRPWHPDFCFHGKAYTDTKLLIAAVGKRDKDAAEFLRQWMDDSPTIAVQTSGSTGIPKVIALEKKHMRQSAMATGAFFECGAGTKVLHCLPSKYIAGKMMWVRALTLGWHLDLTVPQGNPLENCFKIYEFSAMVPLQVNRSLEQISQIKTLIIGGGVLSADLSEALKKLPVQAYATYGMTETATHIALKSLQEEDACYQALPGVQLAVDDRSCLVIHAPHITNADIVTNDVVGLFSKTTFEWLGRADNVINSGGIKLFPEQIEERLSPHIPQRFFIAGIPDPMFGTKLILIVEGTPKVSLLELKNSAILSTYEFPKELYSLDAFVETPTQKIKRNQSLALLGF